MTHITYGYAVRWHLNLRHTVWAAVIVGITYIICKTVFLCKALEVLGGEVGGAYL